MIEDHQLFREAVAGIIGQDRKLEMCGGAGDGEAAPELLRRSRADLALIDLGLPGMGGLELVKRIRSRNRRVKMLVLSMHQESLYAQRALRAGADGYVMKREDGATLLAAIHAVLDGRTWVSPALEKAWGAQRAGEGGGAPPASVDLLSDREMELVRWVGLGLLTRDIAGRMNISVKTVESHRGRIREKLDLATNRDFIQWAIHWVHREAASD